MPSSCLDLTSSGLCFGRMVQAFLDVLKGVSITEAFDRTLQHAIGLAFHLPSPADALNYRIHDGLGIVTMPYWQGPV